MKNREELLSKCLKVAFRAGLEIVEVYKRNFDIELKEDNSPLTEADLRSHKVIQKSLEETGIPILSEEGRNISYEERKSWERLWIVDPLDGTKEFIKRNGEFTVNIALVENGMPVIGVVYTPISEELFFGLEGLGSYKLENCSNFIDLDLKDLLDNSKKLPLKLDRPYTVVASRSHMSVETQEFIDEKKKMHGNVEIQSVGSSLKLCMVAEGKADAYPRFAPTMEWDTAAGHAVVSAMGGTVINWKTKKEMNYNRENLLNDWFLVTA